MIVELDLINEGKLFFTNIQYIHTMYINIILGKIKVLYLVF